MRVGFQREIDVWVSSRSRPVLGKRSPLAGENGQQHQVD